MVKLFYTGSGGFNMAQTLASKSLGGYISNTAVPNGVVNSLFPPLGLVDFYENKKIVNYIGLGLYLFFFEGETSYDIVDLNFRLELNEENEPEVEYFKDLFTYKLAIAPISGDTTNGFYIERVTAGAKPFYLLEDFKTLNYDEVVKFENITLNNSGIGIWINRIFDPKAFKNIFGFESDYWIENDKLPNFDFTVNLNVGFEGVEEESSEN